jgi:SAM-dependent methyltransferase
MTGSDVSTPQEMLVCPACKAPLATAAGEPLPAPPARGRIPAAGGRARRHDAARVDCGRGNGVARHFLPRGTDYTVIDPSLDWLGSEWHAIANTFPCLENRPNFVRGVGEHLPFAAACFDHVLSFWSLNHAREPERVVQEAGRVLRPGGRFLLVLEDMVPRWRDLPRLFRVHRGREARRTLVTAKLSCTLGRRDWPLQDDHLRIRERQLRTWISGRFRVARRAWIGQYLTYDLCRF